MMLYQNLKKTMIKKSFFRGVKLNRIADMKCPKCLYFDKCISEFFEKVEYPMCSWDQNCLNFLSREDNIKNKVIKGGIHFDDYGNVLFNNNFNLYEREIKRFYIISLNTKNQFKGWHGHKNESKYCFCVKGIVKIGMVKIDNFENPQKDLVPDWYILKENDCEILHIPGGYANGAMKIDKNDMAGKVLFFSNMTLEESQNDDYRYDRNNWINNRR